MTEKPWYVYVLRNSANTRIYTGSTNRPAHRLQAHRGERTGGARTTQRWGKGNAVMCMLISGFASSRDARKFEGALKKIHIRGLSGIRGRMAALGRLGKRMGRDAVNCLSLWCEYQLSAYFNPKLDFYKNYFIGWAQSRCFGCGVDIIVQACE